MSYNIVSYNCPNGKIIEEEGANCIVVINEQHTLLDAQQDLLWTSAMPFAQCLIPSDGLDSAQRFDMVNWLMTNYEYIVFVSPIPGMIKEVSKRDAERCVLMCNDKREKKELPNGKVISVVAKEGWYLE